MDYSKSFYNDFDLYDVFSELDKFANNPDYKFDYAKYSAKIIVYLEWIEMLASHVERNIVDLYTIDNLISYRFFVIVNNKQVQDNEILPNAMYYRGVYYLYDLWYKYEIKRGLEVPLQDTALHLSDDYDKNLHLVYNKIKTK